MNGVALLEDRENAFDNLVLALYRDGYSFQAIMEELDATYDVVDQLAFEEAHTTSYTYEVTVEAEANKPDGGFLVTDTFTGEGLTEDRAVANALTKAYDEYGNIQNVTLEELVDETEVVL